jgi:formate--tetrahydrofolate ligase
VTAADLEADGAMTVLLKDALLPNLVQTLENNPAFVHGGPFANIAHGCNSALATTTALHLADYVVTEAGFGADLGAEKFFDIKCRKAELAPSAAVIVATIRALKMHGGVKLDELGKENIAAVEKGFANLARHIRNIGHFGVPAIVAVNTFASDTKAEFDALAALCTDLGVDAVRCTHFADGSKGSEELAHKVVALAEGGRSQFRTLYPDDMTLWDKVDTICREIYGASEAVADKSVRDQFRALQDEGYGSFPICMAKTQYSFSTDPNLKGAPTGHVVPVREVRLAAGAEFVVVITGEIMTMPGLPKVPAANKIGLDKNGNVVGLF